MKNSLKSLPVMTGILLAAGILWGQNITIKEPSNGQTWLKKTEHTIKWMVNGSMDTRVKIRLFDKTSTTNVLKIVDDTLNNGSYKVPANFFSGVPDGEYRIRVKTLDNKVWDDSDVFKLATKLIYDASNLKFIVAKKIFFPDYTLAVGLNISIAPPENWKYPSYFNVMIRNIGKGDARESTNDRILLYYLGREGQFQLRPEIWNEYWYKTISPIKAGRFTMHIIKYFFKFPGKYVLKVWVDDPNNVKETNETNNSIEKTFWVKEK